MSRASRRKFHREVRAYLETVELFRSLGHDPFPIKVKHRPRIKKSAA